MKVEILYWFFSGTENTQGEKIMQAAGEADEPEEAMREAARPVSLVHNTMLNSFWSRIDIQ